VKILIAIDKFKGSISSSEIAHIIAQIIRRKLSDSQIREIPIADGGEGSLEILESYGFKKFEVQTVDALNRPNTATFGFNEVDETAFIELAEICGIAKLRKSERDPWLTTSKGIGLVINKAISIGAKKIVISLGGSASIDGGAGLLEGLGGELLDRNGNPLSGNLKSLSQISSIDVTKIEALVNGIQFLLLADVDNPIVGSQGSAAVFGSQKGLRVEEITSVDQSLTSWCNVLNTCDSSQLLTRAYLGAAGGVALPLVALFSASVESGSQYFIDLLNLKSEILLSDIVITGEGTLDQQSFMGKLVGWIINEAQQAGKVLFVVTGVCEVINNIPAENVIELSKLAGSSEESIRNPGPYLERAAVTILTNSLLF
jgi:glycerate 2-kinase